MKPVDERLLPRINAARCTGCGWCVPSCPWQLLSLEVIQWRKRSVLDREADCPGCGKCARRCPFGVIQMQPREPGGSG